MLSVQQGLKDEGISVRRGTSHDVLQADQVTCEGEA